MSFNFRRGAEAIEEVAKQASSSFARTHYFGIKDGEKAIVRFLTDHDQWIGVLMHSMVPTKAKPDNFEGNWPQVMGAVCRKDPAFAGTYSDCYICDHLAGKGKVKGNPSLRTWALACLREEVIEDGKVVGFRDAVREVKRKKKDSDTEETIQEKAIVVVTMGWKNFFAALQGFAGHYGTVLDRDYIIKRKGSDTDTTYQIIPMDPLFDDKGNKLDVRSEWGKRYATDLTIEDAVTAQSSDEYYARFFDPRVSVDKDGKVSETGEAPAPKADNDVDQERLAELSKRVKSYTGGGNGESADAQAQAGEAAPASGMKSFD